MATSSSRRRRGYVTEELVAAAYADDGFPHAEPAPRGTPGRDILGTPGIANEVKARTGFDPLAALRQATRNADGDLPVVVMRPNGSGPATIDDWPAFTTFGRMRSLLRAAGYGNPLRSTESAETPEPGVADGADGTDALRALLTRWHSGPRAGGA